MPVPATQLVELEARLSDANTARHLLEQAIRVGPKSALVHHAFGLFLVRSGERGLALHHI